jgi:phosphate-selective porin
MEKWLCSLGMGLVLGLVGVSFGQETQKSQNLDQALTGSSLPKAQEQTAGGATEDRLSKMEQMLQKQNEEINLLRKQLSNQDEGNLNKARSDEIRQMVKEILADEEFRNQIYQPTLQAGYDKGFYIKSSDDSFYLNTSAKTQFRYTGIQRQDRDRTVVGNVRQDDTSGFDFTRMRLYFTGWMWTKDLKYNIALEGSTNSSVDGGIKLKHAYFDYQYTKGQYVQWGKFLLPFGKQAVNASTYKQMFIDYSMATATFTPGDSLGVMGHGDVVPNKLGYSIGLFNGANDGQDGSARSDDKFAVAGRTVYHVLAGYDEGDEVDLVYHEKPAMDVGASMMYNQNRSDANGQSLVYGVSDLIRDGRSGYGTSSSLGTDVLQFGADTGFKYRGFSLSAEYFTRVVNDDAPWSQWRALTDGNNGSAQGGYIQAGYFIIPKKLDINGRLSSVWGLGDDIATEEAIGMNYYIRGHSLKLSADVTHVDECPITSAAPGYTRGDEMWMYRLQIQATMD